MIFLRLSLYLICILSIGWSALVFGGPALITKLVSKYTDGSVILSNVKISPTLAVNIGRLDFSFGNSKSGSPLKGFSRSTEVSWSVFKEKPFLFFDVGPTFVTGMAVSENLQLYTPSLNNLNWEDLFLTIKAKGVDLTSSGSVEDLFVEGTLRREFFKIYNLRFEAQKVNLQEHTFGFSARQISGGLDEFDFNVSFLNQKYLATFNAGEVASSKVNFSSSNVTGELDLSGSDKNFKFHLDDVNFPEFEASVNEIKVDGNYTLDNVFEKVRINFLNGSFSRSSLDFSSVFTEIIKRKQNHYSLSANGNLGEFDIYNLDNFIGSMPSSDFKINLDLEGLASNISGEVEINFKGSGVHDIDGFGDIVLNLKQSESLDRCLHGDCELADFDFVYQLNLDDDWLKGRSFCPTTYCYFGGAEHSLRTSNTVNIFTILKNEGVLNPLSIMYLYGVINSGKKINNGHEVKF